MEKAKILVLGALGNVGEAVTQALLESGADVRTGDLSIDKMLARFGERVEAVAFDFMKPETFAPALQGVERLFLLRPPQIANVRKYLFPVIDAAKACGVKQVVFLSLIGIEQNTVVPHYKVEQYLKASGMAYTFLRSSFFMQNLNTTHRAEIRDEDRIYVPVGMARTSFIDVRDIGCVAAVVLTAPGHENRAYNLTGGEALDYEQVAGIFTRVLGRKVTYENPSSMAFLLQKIRTMPLPFALVMTWLYANTKKGMAEVVTDEVRRLTGLPPRGLEQYVRDYQDCWKKG